MTSTRVPHFRDLPLVWKLLIPFLALMVSLGVLGGFLIVRDLSTRAQTSIDRDLTRRSLEARSFMRERELYLLESANFAANLQGLAEATASRDARLVTRSLESVVALKTDLDVLAVTDRRGAALATFTRTAFGTAPRIDRSAVLPNALVSAVLADARGTKASGFVDVGGVSYFFIAAPVCAGARACAPAGVALAGMRLDRVAADAARALALVPAQRAAQGGISVFGSAGNLLASAGTAAPKPPASTDERLVRKAASDFATLYSPLSVQGTRAGTLAISVPTDPAFAAVRRAGIRLALILFAAMIVVIAFGTLLSRAILNQVRALLRTSRAIGGGDLEARAPVMADDELGELAQGVNEMASQLQASYETLELRVAQRTEEVQRLLNERTDFFASISHEFRTPLGVIGRQADMMLSPRFSSNGKSRARAGSAIKQAVTQLGSFIDDILDMAKAEAGRLDVEVEEVSMREMLDEIRPTLEGLAHGAEIALALDIPKGLPPVKADRNAMRGIVLNLVDNAVKYTPARGRITVAARERGDVVEVSVADTGVGIPASAADRVFEPFYRVPGTRTQRGQASSGLGLALAKRLIEAQGGTIWFASEPGAGATFTFTVPPAGPTPAASKSTAGRRDRS